MLYSGQMLELKRDAREQVRANDEDAALYREALKSQAQTLKPYFPSPLTIERAREIAQDTSTPDMKEAAAELLSKFTLLPTQEGSQTVFWRGQNSFYHDSQLFLSADGEMVHCEEAPDAKPKSVTSSGITLVYRNQFLLPSKYPADFMGMAWRKLSLVVNSR